MDVPQSNLAEAPGAPGRTVLCPGCGYDLRGSTGERCSECGLVLDWAALQRSAFPWAHRKSLGRLRAFLKTVWLVTADAASLRQETAKAQSPRDGASFRRWVAVVLSACFGVVVVMVLSGGGMHELAVGPDEYSFGLMPRWTQDLLVPWSAGITIAPALFVYSTVLAFYIVGVPRSIFRTRGLPQDYRRTVEAISGYVVAPLVLLIPATVGYVGLYFLSQREELMRRGMLMPLLMIGSFIIVMVAVGGTAYRMGQWRARTTHAGYATGFAAMAELLLRWAVGAVVVLGVVPWCVGLVWIVFDSFRR